MQNYRIRMAGLLLLAGVFMIPAFGQHSRYGRDYQRQGRNMMRLELTEEQRDQLTALRTQHQNQMEPLRNRLSELRADQRTLLSEEVVDLNAVNKVIDEQTDLMNQMSKLRVEHSVNVRGVYTDEQRQKLDQTREFHRQGRTYGNDLPRSPRRGRSFHRNVG